MHLSTSTNYKYSASCGSAGRAEGCLLIRIRGLGVKCVPSQARHAKLINCTCGRSTALESRLAATSTLNLMQLSQAPLNANEKRQMPRARCDAHAILLNVNLRGTLQSRQDEYAAISRLTVEMTRLRAQMCDTTIQVQQGHTTQEHYHTLTSVSIATAVKPKGDGIGILEHKP